MFPFLLYLITGLVTGLTTFWIKMWGVWGAPSHPTMSISLWGSFLLTITAYYSLFQPRRALQPALIFIFFIWSFYFAAILHGFKDLLFAYPLFSILLLITVTVYCAAGLLSFIPKNGWRWLYPTEIKQQWRIGIFAATLTIFVGFIAKIMLTKQS